MLKTPERRISAVSGAPTSSTPSHKSLARESEAREVQDVLKKRVVYQVNANNDELNQEVSDIISANLNSLKKIAEVIEGSSQYKNDPVIQEKIRGLSARLGAGGNFTSVKPICDALIAKFHGNIAFINAEYNKLRGAGPKGGAKPQRVPTEEEKDEKKRELKVNVRVLNANIIKAIACYVEVRKAKSGEDVPRWGGDQGNRLQFDELETSAWPAADAAPTIASPRSLAVSPYPVETLAGAFDVVALNQMVHGLEGENQELNAQLGRLRAEMAKLSRGEKDVVAANARAEALREQLDDSDRRLRENQERLVQAQARARAQDQVQAQAQEDLARAQGAVADADVLRRQLIDATVSGKAKDEEIARLKQNIQDTIQRLVSEQAAANGILAGLSAGQAEDAAALAALAELMRVQKVNYDASQGILAGLLARLVGMEEAAVQHDVRQTQAGGVIDEIKETLDRVVAAEAKNNAAILALNSSFTDFREGAELRIDEAIRAFRLTLDGHKRLLKIIRREGRQREELNLRRHNTLLGRIGDFQGSLTEYSEANAAAHAQTAQRINVLTVEAQRLKDELNAAIVAALERVGQNNDGVVARALAGQLQQFRAVIEDSQGNNAQTLDLLGRAAEVMQAFNQNQAGAGDRDAAAAAAAAAALTQDLKPVLDALQEQTTAFEALQKEVGSQRELIRNIARGLDEANTRIDGAQRLYRDSLQEQRRLFEEELRRKEAAFEVSLRQQIDGARGAAQEDRDAFKAELGASRDSFMTGIVRERGVFEGMIRDLIARQGEIFASQRVVIDEQREHMQMLIAGRNQALQQAEAAGRENAEYEAVIEGYQSALQGVMAANKEIITLQNAAQRDILAQITASNKALSDRSDALAGLVRANETAAVGRHDLVMQGIGQGNEMSRGWRADIEQQIADQEERHRAMFEAALERDRDLRQLLSGLRDPQQNSQHSPAAAAPLSHGQNISYGPTYNHYYHNGGEAPQSDHEIGRGRHNQASKVRQRGSEPPPAAVNKVDVVTQPDSVVGRNVLAKGGAQILQPKRGRPFELTNALKSAAKIQFSGQCSTYSEEPYDSHVRATSKTFFEAYQNLLRNCADQSGANVLQLRLRAPSASCSLEEEGWQMSNTQVVALLATYIHLSKKDGIAIGENEELINNFLCGGGMSIGRTNHEVQELFDEAVKFFQKESVLNHVLIWSQVEARKEGGSIEAASILQKKGLRSDVLVIKSDVALLFQEAIEGAIDRKSGAEVARAAEGGSERHSRGNSAVNPSEHFSPVGAKELVGRESRGDGKLGGGNGLLRH